MKFLVSCEPQVGVDTVDMEEFLPESHVISLEKVSMHSQESWGKKHMF